MVVLMLISLSACGGGRGPENPMDEDMLEPYGEEAVEQYGEETAEPTEEYSEEPVADAPQSGKIGYSFVNYTLDEDDDYCEFSPRIILHNDSGESAKINPGNFVCVLDGQRYNARGYGRDAVLAPGEDFDFEAVFFKIPHFGFAEIYYLDDFVCSVDMADGSVKTNGTASAAGGTLDFEYVDCYADDDGDYIDFGIGFNVSNNTGNDVVYNRGNCVCVLDGQYYYANADDCDNIMGAGEKDELTFAYFKIPYMGMVDVYYKNTFICSVNTADYDSNA